MQRNVRYEADEPDEDAVLDAVAGSFDSLRFLKYSDESLKALLALLFLFALFRLYRACQRERPSRRWAATAPKTWSAAR